MSLVLLFSAFLLIASPAVASETSASPTRFSELGECLAFIAIESGVDGKKEVHEDVATTLSAMGSEFMFEASLMGLDDNTAHTFVVEKLVEMNLTANEQGSEAVRSQYGDKCRDVAISVVSDLPSMP